MNRYLLQNNQLHGKSHIHFTNLEFILQIPNSFYKSQIHRLLVSHQKTNKKSKKKLSKQKIQKYQIKNPRTKITPPCAF